jgi:peptide/nickel transport system permease protein
MRSPGVGIPEGLAERYLTGDFVWHLVLPYLTGVLFFMAQPILLMRSSLIDVINDDFIEIKEAEGLPRRTIVYKHAARNAILPMITQLGIVFGVAVGGAVVIETVFSWPGMGRAMVDAVNHNDYPLAQGAFFVLGTSVILANFVADLAYVWADPRVKHD